MNNLSRVSFFLALLSLCIFLDGCYVVSYSYRDPDAPKSAKRQEQTLYYRVTKVPQLTFGGAYPQLVESVGRNPVFARSLLVEDRPTRGLYVEVNTREAEMSTGSLIWGYISLSFLHILPAYSGSGGFDVRFRVWRDGRELRVYEYPVRRTIFAWLPVLPFVWVNAFTTSEKDGMAAISEQFFQDALRDGIFEPGALPLPQPAGVQ